MPSPSSRLDDQGAGFVVLPLSILFHPDLTDADKVLLLVLDQYANREGFRDGTVQASDREIAARMGKSVSSVRISLHRIEAIRPPILAFEMASPRRRDSIRLRYDRYGAATVATVGPHVPVPQDEDSDARFRVSPVAAYQETHDTVAVVPAKSSDTRKRVSACDTRIRALHPIERHPHPHHPGGAGDTRNQPSGAEVHATGPTVAPHATTPRAPETLADLVGWLPAISDDAKAIARLHRLIPLWHARLVVRCPAHAGSLVDWIQDALIQGCEKDDVVTYAQKLLGRWAGLGGRPDVELAREAAQRLASEAAAAGTTNLPSPVATPLLGAPRPSHADRTRAELARIKEGFRQNKLRKEAIDAQSP